MNEASRSYLVGHVEGCVGECHTVHEVVERHGGVDVVGLWIEERRTRSSVVGDAAAVLSVFADVSCRRVTPLFVDGAHGQRVESMFATTAPAANCKGFTLLPFRHPGSRTFQNFQHTHI